MIILPGDFDNLGSLTFASVKSVYKSGMSVFRERASDDDVTQLALDRLHVPEGDEPRTIHGFIEVETLELRGMAHPSMSGRLLCVYDETVPRKFDKDAPHVPTHAGIFQTHFPSKEPDKKEKTENACLVFFNHLRESKRLIRVENFRGGAFLELNDNSKAGKYTFKKIKKD